jgi:hypothetical protein
LATRVAQIAALVVALLAAGAAAFGLWHLVVGGAINGNPRAAGFGAVLLVTAGLVCVAAVRVGRVWPRS